VVAGRDGALCRRIFMNPFDFLVLALAVFRLSLMITEESGPGWCFKNLRSLVKKKAPKVAHMDEGIECFRCMSMQFALVVVIIARFFFHSNPVCDVIVYALAISGAAILANKVITKE
jgi:hypothetical protein